MMSVCHTSLQASGSVGKIDRKKKRSGFLPEAREIMKGKVLATREKSFACQLKLWPEVHNEELC